MKHKTNSMVGRALYAMRLAIAEPPFVDIRRFMELQCQSRYAQQKQRHR